MKACDILQVETGASSEGRGPQGIVVCGSMASVPDKGHGNIVCHKIYCAMGRGGGGCSQRLLL